MRSYRRFAVILVVLAACGMATWGLFQTTRTPSHPLDQLMPQGALLYIEAKDFAGLLKDWNNSQEQAAWLKSDDYRVFSNSRLFLRLTKAADEFAAAAGLRPNGKLLAEAAGTQTAIAISELGNLAVSVLSCLSSGDFTQSSLWQQRNKFQSRAAPGNPF